MGVIVLVNPLATCFDWFIQFTNILPAPAVSFFWLVLSLFVISSIIRWFL